MNEVGQNEGVDRAPWAVDELIERAERIMSSAPELFAPGEEGSKKSVNVRLIRDYVVREFIPRPMRIGREARFGLDHLVHLLAVRALLRNQKWSLPAIKASFETTDTDRLLTGVLAPVRRIVEAEYQRATRTAVKALKRDQESLQTPPLNPAQALIQKFKAAAPVPAERRDLSLYRASASDAVSLLTTASAGEQRQPSQSKRHISLDPWCEVVVDEQRMKELTSEEIERLGEALKRRLKKETAR